MTVIRNTFLKGLARYIRFSNRHAAALLGLMALLFLGTGLGTIALFSHVESNFIVLLPDDYPVVKAMENIRAKSRSFGGLQIIFESDYPEEIAQALPKIAGRLEAEPFVRKVYWKRTGYDFFKAKKLLYLSVDELTDLRDRIDRRIRQEKLGPLFLRFDEEEGTSREDFQELVTRYRQKYPHGMGSPYMTNDTKTLTMIEVDPEGGAASLESAQTFLEAIQKILRTDPLIRALPIKKIHMTGNIRNRVEEAKALNTDLKRAAFFCAIAIPLLLSLYFRKLAAVLYVFAPIAVGLTLTFTVTYFTIGHLNVITSFLFSILMGLGDDVAVHIVSRYFDERGAGKNHEEAMLPALSSTGRAALVAAGATWIAFFLLTLNDFKGFSQFGWIISTGLIFTCLASYLLLPPLLAVTEGRREKSGIAPQEELPIPEEKRRPLFLQPILMIGILFIFIALPYAARVHFEYDFNKLKYRLPSLEEARTKLSEVVSGRNIPAVVIITSEKESETLEAAVNAKKASPDPTPTVAGFTSRYHFLPKGQETKIGILRQIRDLVDDRIVEKLMPAKHRHWLDEFKESLEATPFTLGDVPSNVTDPYRGDPAIPGELAFINAPNDMELADGRNAMLFAEDLKDFRAGDKVYHPTNDSVILGEVLRAMLRDSKKALAFSSIGVLAFIILDFRRLRRIVAVLIPLGTGIAWMLGLMGLFDVRLNFFNMIAIPLIMGLGIASGIHIVHRYLEEGEGQVDKVIRTAGSACFLSSITTIAGFASLAVADHPGLKSLGIVVSLGIGSCLAAALTVLPAVLTFWEKRKNAPPL